MQFGDLQVPDSRNGRSCLRQACVEERYCAHNHGATWLDPSRETTVYGRRPRVKYREPIRDTTLTGQPMLDPSVKSYRLVSADVPRQTTQRSAAFPCCVKAHAVALLWTVRNLELFTQ
ncbi:hypothetical protein HBH92_002280 [Parastagonospora nodorum]|nr:hypothetical protein HBH92_002280 [Parastagonospora nodorum]KAH4456125.1 hypothetical protein HBH93_002280 [Parastagonospora nodorum]KAH4468637.1 hypothetical protein HBH91_020340 [Parastagonospora nodorum]KAH4516491.1 hypothetical protein HBH89_021680 [Parastagonospora nodorum]KAH4554295.1 hypothetical protein HBH85_013730 [Parastagonospora nodorum]